MLAAFFRIVVVDGVSDVNVDVAAAVLPKRRSWPGFESSDVACMSWRDWLRAGLL